MNLVIADCLKRCAEIGASDLHLSAGMPPIMRLNGDLQRMSDSASTDKEIRDQMDSLMNERQKRKLAESLDCDFSFEVPGLSRFRVNVFHQSRGIAVAFRLIAEEIPSLESIDAPPFFADLILKPRGLVLFTGPTGAGKSTTQAAMINHLNELVSSHIVTIEDPIEFVHTPKKCLINQREIGAHAMSFDGAMRACLREDPDVILVGEMRDLETIRLALTAAETGHLVIGTLHTAGGPKTVDRIIDVFPTDEKEIVRSMLSESLEAVISQVLCKRKDGKGRVAAHEIMLGTTAIRNLIREGKTAQMYATIQSGGAYGMQTLDQGLMGLVKRNMISLAEAKGLAKMPEDFAAA